MEVNEVKKFCDDKVEIKVNSKFPAHQGYSPMLIQEDHLNISLNGHRINIAKSAFNELINILNTINPINIVHNVKDKVENVIKKSKDEIIKDTIIPIELSLEELSREYKVIYDKDVPLRYKNDKAWIKKALLKK